MTKNRLEAFTDGVIAIIVTIMVLELDLPKSNEMAEIINFLQAIWIYALSFTYVTICWMNHHHLLYTVKKINGKIMIVNNLLLFCLSLVPIATKWLSVGIDGTSVFFYGIVLNLVGIMYVLLVRIIIKGDNEISRKIYEHEGAKKEITTMIGYTTALLVSFVTPKISIIIYVLVALIWIVPDRRIENNIECAELNNKNN